MSEHLKKLKEALELKGIKVSTSFNEMSLVFPDGDKFTFKADGCQGVFLQVSAEVNLHLSAGI